MTNSNVTAAEASEALRFHNEARKEVDVPPLEWSQELAAYAQAWANHLAELDCEFKHRPYDGEWKQLYGENIFAGSGTPYSSLDASKSWYSEKKEYTFGPISDLNWAKTGHYTQMVWRNTQKLGMGTATCPNGTVIIVANYNPAGNVTGQKPY